MKTVIARAKQKERAAICASLSYLTRNRSFNTPKEQKATLTASKQDDLYEVYRIKYQLSVFLLFQIQLDAL